MTTVEEEKALAARYALERIPSDARIVGLGSGSTVEAFVRELRRSDLSKRLRFVPTSSQIEEAALRAGLELVDIDHVETVDFTVDGADEIDPNLNLLKGGGGALTREKVLAVNSDVYVIIADHRKLVRSLCSTHALPVEVLRYGRTHVARLIAEAVNGIPELRLTRFGIPFTTDNGNYVLDVTMPEPLEDPEATLTQLKLIPGVVEVGLFVGLADEAYVAEGREVRVISS
ncbi:MAG: ribose-5-phosphate isomerase RpiA [Candidatus Korarchaeota archaeon]|nr:ribose-5-phosphate isomerase RpiA [Candidatus Korarchaeota archaeon]